MTQNDLEHVKICFWSALLDSERLAFKNSYVKSNKHRLKLSAAECRSTTLVSGNINHFWIFESVSHITVFKLEWGG